MDLGAYARIDVLSAVAKANGIEIPRLRGYRLMSEEEPVSEADIQEMIESDFLDGAEDVFREGRVLGFVYHEHSTGKNRLVRRHIKQDKDGKNVFLKWDTIHGKTRKRLKLLRKHIERDVRKQFELWNRYAGRDDVLYIHAKIGSANWSVHDKDDFRNEPWFLDAVDDAFDSVYCDIYAKIDPDLEVKQ